MSLKPPTRSDHRHARRLLVIAGVALALAMAAMLLLAPGAARAGTYVAVQCDAQHNVGSSNAVFTRTSDHYTPGTACAGAGGGKLIRHHSDVTKPGRWGAWSWYPPAGTVFTQITSQSHVAHDAGHKGNYTIIDGSGQVHYRWPREGTYDAVDWAAGVEATAFSAWLACHGGPDGNCGSSANAHNHVRRLWFTFRDSSSPVLSLAGELFEAGPRRGPQSFQVSASDVGGGVWRWRVSVNGVPADSAEQPCDIIPGGAARSFVPCPGSASQSFALETDSAPFRQGSNEVRVCVTDVGWPANESCLTRTVQVDNGCPSSGEGASRSLDAGFGSGTEAKVASNRRATVRGRLTGAGAGARICVFATPSRPGAEEYLEGRSVADDGGRFTYVAARGPSRGLRIVHRHRSRSIERELVLRVRARPRLKVGPRSHLRNGQVARFRGKLPGPWAERRVVVLQARLGTRWQAFKTARTGTQGRFTARYRFRETTARRLYRFRAVVREQAGYPYLKGASPVRRVVVSG